MVDKKADTEPAAVQAEQYVVVVGINVPDDMGVETRYEPGDLAEIPRKFLAGLLKQGVVAPLGERTAAQATTEAKAQNEAMLAAGFALPAVTEKGGE